MQNKTRVLFNGISNIENENITDPAITSEPVTFKITLHKRSCLLTLCARNLWFVHKKNERAIVITVR
jgi:hypothetical protein